MNMFNQYDLSSNKEVLSVSYTHLEVMGHKAGWIALYSGMAGGGDVILIPELSYDIHNIGNTLSLIHIYSSRIYRWYPQHQPHQCSGRRFGWK